MEQHRDKWWQIRLNNVLVSMALFGLALALAKVFTQLSDNLVVTIAAAVGSITFFCAAIAGVFGRFKRGAAAGLIGSLLLAVGTLEPALLVPVLVALVFLCVMALNILDWHP